MGLLTAAEKAAIPGDIQQKHDDWGEDVIIKLDPTFTSQDNLGGSFGTAVTYSLEQTVLAIVHSQGLKAKEGADKEAKSFWDAGIGGSINFFVLIHKDAVTGITFEKNDIIEVRGNEYFIQYFSENLSEWHFAIGEEKVST